jgi:hypothetical protein
LASLIQATLLPIVAPLVAELAASRQANECQVDTLRAQAERIGVLTAEVAALKAAQSPVVSNLTLEPPGVAPQDASHGLAWRAACVGALLAVVPLLVVAGLLLLVLG